MGTGWHQGQTCVNLFHVNLFHNGKVASTINGAHHPTERREKRETVAWNLGELLGPQVTIQIVDNASGSWGHFDVDHIVETDTSP